MPKSKSRKKKNMVAKKHNEQPLQKGHPDWREPRQQMSSRNYIPNMRTKQNANWEKRS